MALARIQLGLTQPVAERFQRDAQIAGNLGLRFPTAADETKRLRTKFRRLGGMTLRPRGSSLGTIRSKRTGLH